MSPLVQVRLAVAIIAIVLWAYGYTVDDDRIRLGGIILLAVSLLLRFAGPRTPRRGQ